MKARLPWLLTAAMGFGALVLWLNLQERDQFENGSIEPVDGSEAAAQDLERWMPRTIPHDGHEHAVEVVEQRRTLTLRDRDGWYRLFWAGDDLYHYKELVHLAGDLQNATAVDPAGTWTIHARAAAAPCGTSPLDTTAVYALRVSDGISLAGDAPGGLPESFPGLTYRCLAPHLPAVLDFSWVLAK